MNKINLCQICNVWLHNNCMGINRKIMLYSLKLHIGWKLVHWTTLESNCDYNSLLVIKWRTSSRICSAMAYLRFDIIFDQCEHNHVMWLMAWYIISQRIVKYWIGTDTPSVTELQMIYKGVQIVLFIINESLRTGQVFSPTV